MIQVDRLSFSYTGKAPYVLRDISLSIQNGEYLSIVGENGSGKSTLMRLLLGFLKPTRGALSVSAGRIGYVPQRADSLNSGFPITVFEMLNSYRRLLRIKDKRAVPTALGQVGMSGFSSALMGTLSGGQAQRILIARALMGNPDLLILDEPSTGVDAESQREIYALLNRLNREQGVTILAVEHNLKAALSNSTLIYHLSDGQGNVCTPHRFSEKSVEIGEE